MKITSNAVWLFAFRFGGDLLNLVLFVAISRTLGPVGIGVYSYAFAVSSFVFVIGSIGIEDFGVRQYVRLEPSRRGALIAELLGTQAVIITVAVLGLAAYLALTGPTRATLAIVSMFAFYQVCAAMANTLFIPAIGQQRMVGPAFCDFLCRGSAYVAGAVAVRFGHQPLETAMLGFILAGVLLVGLAMASIRRHGGMPGVVVSKAALMRIGNVLWSFAAVDLFAQLFARIGVITLTLISGEAAAGVFATGLRLIEVALMPLNIIGLASYPRLSQLFVEDRRVFRHFGTNLIWLMLGAAGVVCWGFYFVSPALLVPVLGNKYAGTEPVIQIMALVVVVQAIEIVFGRIMLAADRQVARAGIIGSVAVLSIVLNLVLVSRFGLNGAIAAIGLGYAIIDVAYAGALRQALSSPTLVRALGTLGAGIGLGAVAAWLFNTWSLSPWAPAAAFFLAFAAVAAMGFSRARLADGGALPAP